MKTILPFVIIFVGLVLFSFFLRILKNETNEISNRIQEVDQEMSERVGDTIIVMKDTLLIVDYSVSRSSYIMNNGVELSEKLIETYERNRHSKKIHPIDEEKEKKEDSSNKN